MIMLMILVLYAYIFLICEFNKVHMYVHNYSFQVIIWDQILEDGSKSGITAT